MLSLSNVDSMCRPAHRCVSTSPRTSFDLCWPTTLLSCCTRIAGGPVAMALLQERGRCDRARRHRSCQQLPEKDVMHRAASVGLPKAANSEAVTRMAEVHVEGKRQRARTARVVADEC